MKTSDISDRGVVIISLLVLLCFTGGWYYISWDYIKQSHGRPTHNSHETIVSKNRGLNAQGHKVLRIREIPKEQTYEISQWVDAGDWSHDNGELTVTVPTTETVFDIDYVEDHYEDYLMDPEDEISFPPEHFETHYE